MESTVASLIDRLGLQPHPEGGYYREIYRSVASVTPSDERGARAALTSILFLLVDGGPSRWHGLRSDEIWHFIEGAPAELLQLDGELADSRRRVLGPSGENAEPVASVPAGSWQAARTLGSYTLVGCTVGPGFEFGDFRLLADEPELAEELRQRFPDLVSLI